MWEALDALDAWVASPPVDTALTWFYGLCAVVVLLWLMKGGGKPT